MPSRIVIRHTEIRQLHQFRAWSTQASARISIDARILEIPYDLSVTNTTPEKSGFWSRPTLWKLLLIVVVYLAF